MCLTNIEETEFIKEGQPTRMAYKVTWHDSMGAYTGPFSPERVIRGEWMIPEDAIDHIDTEQRREVSQEWDGGTPTMKRNPSSGLRLAYTEYGPCYHVFWTQANAAKFVAAFVEDFGHLDNRMATKLRIEAVRVRGEIRTGTLGSLVSGGGLTAATATRIMFEHHA